MTDVTDRTYRTCTVTLVVFSVVLHVLSVFCAGARGRRVNGAVTPAATRAGIRSVAVFHELVVSRGVQRKILQVLAVQGFFQELINYRAGLHFKTLFTPLTW